RSRPRGANAASIAPADPSQAESPSRRRRFDARYEPRCGPRCGAPQGDSDEGRESQRAERERRDEGARPRLRRVRGRVQRERPGPPDADQVDREPWISRAKPRHRGAIANDRYREGTNVDRSPGGHVAEEDQDPCEHRKPESEEARAGEAPVVAAHAAPPAG